MTSPFLTFELKNIKRIQLLFIVASKNNKSRASLPNKLVLHISVTQLHFSATLFSMI